MRVRGIEPRPQAWEAHVLPIYYTRFVVLLLLLLIFRPSKQYRKLDRCTTRGPALLPLSAIMLYTQILLNKARGTAWS